METVDTIKDFWFGNEDDDSIVATQRAALWWNKNPLIDEAIRQRFLPFLTQAAERKLDAWADTAAGRLALILLTDQFPRNIYRDNATAFSFDTLAREWCKQGLRNGDHRLLRPIERVFFYLPLEHSESLQDQEESVALFQALAIETATRHKQTFDGFFDFAVRHHDIIRRFGRFPHRNHILGRQSTTEELAFLEQPGSGF